MGTTKEAKPQGMTNTNLIIPERLHDTMKALREIRQQREESGVKLNRLYREAVEQYINSKPQQALLKESNGIPRTGKAAGD